MVVVVAFVLSLFLKAPPLRAVSAVQEAADARAADEALLAQQAAEQTGELVEPGLAAAAPDAEPGERGAPSRSVKE